MTAQTAEPRTAGERWIPNDRTFGARLALVRQRMGWGNIAEAAMACGLPVASWRNWERDGRLPRRLEETATVISKRTGCDYLWLLAGPVSDGTPPIKVSSPNMADHPRPLPTRPAENHPSGRGPQGHPATHRRPVPVGAYR